MQQILSVIVSVCLSVITLLLKCPLAPETNDSHGFLLGFVWLVHFGKTFLHKSYGVRNPIRDLVGTLCKHRCGISETQQLLEKQLVGRMFYQTQATGYE